jgi:uncharacterized membrane protein
MLRLTDYPVRKPRLRSAVVGAVAVWAFGLPGLLLGGLLTTMRVGSELHCDDPFLGCAEESVLACGTVLGDEWATVLGLPLTTYASAYFAVVLGLATAVLIRPGPTAVVRTPLLVAAWTAVAVCGALAAYAAVWLQAVCLYCLFLDGACLGVLLAALLIHRGGARTELRMRVTWVSLLACGLGFAAAVAGQRLWIRTLHAEAASREALHPCVVALRELETPALRIASGVIAARDPEATPDVATALFLDLSCAHCRAEYEFWREYQATLADRGVNVELQVFHFPRGCSVAEGAADISRTRACDAARAHLCLAGGDSGRSLALLGAMMAGQEEAFTRERLAAIAGEVGGEMTALDACMQSPATAAALARHVSFAETVGQLYAAPGALLVPLVDGRPTGTAQQVQGRKPQEFYDRWFERYAQAEGAHD